MIRTVPRSRVGHRPLVIAGAFLLQVLVAYIFVRYLARKVAYEGLLYRDTNPVTIGISILIGLVPALWMRLRLSRPSDGVVWMLYLLAIVPASAMLPLNPALTERQAVEFVALVTASFCMLTAVPYLGLTPLPRSKLLARHGWTLLVIVGGLGLAATIAQFGISLQLLSLADVYDARLTFRTTAAGANPIFSYLIVWLQNVFGPLLIIGGLVRRSAIGLFIGAVAEFWVYQTLGNRQALVAAFACWVVWRLGRRRSERGPSILLWGSIALAIFSTAVDESRGSFLSGYFLVRVMMLPAVLMGDYFAYFTYRPVVLLRDGLLGALGRSPYPTAIAFTIGLEFFRNSATSANGNLWADAYANFGFVGLFVVPAVLAVLLWLLDNGTTGAAPGAVGGALAVTVLSLANGGLQTILVTNGFAPLILFLVATGGEVLAPDHPYWFPMFRRPAPVRRPVPLVRPVGLSRSPSSP